MKAMQVIPSPTGSSLVETELPTPEPGNEEVLIRVRAAGFTPTELLWYPTSHTKDGRERNGAVLSHEFSGDIAALGKGVTGLAIGDEVYGMNDWFENGGMAEYCVTRPAWIAPKPRTLTHVEAASVPISALTAWQGLFDRARLLPGDKVLIHGGAGAVGSFAIQLAHERGAYVVTTVSSRNIEFVQSLGADQVIDYQAVPFEKQVHDVDVLFDTVGGETLERSWSTLRPDGRMVTVAAAGDATSDERVKQAFFIVEPRSEQLIDIARKIDEGQLLATVDTVIPMSQANDVLTNGIARSGRGKIVVTTP